MRHNVVFFVLIGLCAVLGIHMVLRSRAPHIAPIAAADAPAPSASASAPLASASAGKAPAAPKENKPKLGRPLRVLGLGWDLIAPGLIENGGAKPNPKSAFGKAGLVVSLAATDDLSEVEQALARGGADEDGADIAILPLPSYVASHEKLRALDPVIFYVTGFSSGREVLIGKEKSLDALYTKNDAGLRVEGAAPTTLLGLFALDAIGVSPDRVTLVGPKDEAKLTATSKSALAEDKETAQLDILLSTADAARLVPFVALAQASLLEKSPEAVVTWVKHWTLGQAALSGDPAGSARSISRMEGAPEPIELLARLGETESVSLADNAELMKLSGRGAVNLSSLLDYTWSLWRGAKLTTVPPPARAPVEESIVASLIRAEPKLAKQRPSKGSEPSKKATDRPLFTHHQRGAKLDEEALTDMAGWLAGLFPRSSISVVVHRNAKLSEELAGRTIDRYGIAESRLREEKLKAVPGVVASIAVWPVE